MENSKDLKDVSNLHNVSFLRGFKQFLPFIRPYLLMGLLGTLLTIPIGALDAVVASFLKPFMDRVMVGQEQEFATMVPIYILGFALVQGCFLYSSALINAWVGGRICLDIKDTLYHKLLYMSTDFYDRNNAGSIYFRFCQDADLASSGLVRNISFFLRKFFSSASLIVVLLYNSWQLSFMAVGMLLLLIWPMTVVKRRIKKISEEYVQLGAKVVPLYNETTDGNRIIKTFVLKTAMYARFKKLLGKIFHLNIKMVRDTNWLPPAMHLVTSMGVAGVLYFGLHLILTEVITPGTFVAFLAALIMLYTPIKNIGGNFINMQKSLLALERIYQVLNETSFEESASDPMRKQLKGIHQSICFSNVHFSYDQEREILRGISFEVKIGTKVALVGNSGGGKTTVCSLIPRLYNPDSGSISIDGIDIRDFSLDSLRSNIAMVFQDNFLFDGTIRENLLCGNKNATEEELQEAVRDAYLDDFVNKLEKGLDTIIGSRGLMLSGGQKQRVAIARAILKNAPLAILDEATSALDNRSEKVVQQALDKLMQGRTTIVIAHRLSTIMDADKIIVINDGLIAESGTHAELLQKDGAYATLYNMQFSNDAIPVPPLQESGTQVTESAHPDTPRAAEPAPHT